MHRTPLWLSGAALSLSLAITGCATDTGNLSGDAGKTADQPLERLSEAYPWIEDSLVSDSPMPALLEIRTPGGQRLYTDPQGRFLVQGKLLEIGAKGQVVNHSEASDNAYRRALMDLAPAEGVITYEAPEPKYTMTVFTDVTCPYCQKLHRDVEALNDAGVTVRYYAFPRHGLKSPSFAMHNAIWCSDDPKKALNDAKADPNGAAQDAECASPVAMHFRLGERVGARSTPTILLEDGSKISGYLPPEDLLKKLEAAKAAISR